MKFKLKPYFKNQFPISAVLIGNSSPKFWLQEIQRMGFQLADVSVFPVPSSTEQTNNTIHIKLLQVFVQAINLQ